MLKNIRFFFVLSVPVLLCVGCGDGIERAALMVKDPSRILYAFAVLAGTVAILLTFLGGCSVWVALLEGLRYTSVVSAIVAPLYALMLDPSFSTSKGAGIAMGLSGIIGIVVTSLLLREYRRTHCTSGTAAPDDGEEESGLDSEARRR